MSQSFPIDIKKNKLKWAGDLEGLKLFISDELKLKGKWKSPRGGTWQFLSEHLTVTWYMTSKTILFQGPHGSEVYNTLKKKAEAPAVINNDLNNSSAHLIVGDFEVNEYENEKEADVSDVEIINVLMSKDEMGDRDSQEGMQRVNSKGDQISCNECKILSVDIAEIKLGLSLLWMKVIKSETSGCGAEENRNLHKENDLLKAEVKSLKVELAANKVDSNSDKVINICGSKDAFKNS